jgi:hypothetical protein
MEKVDFSYQHVFSQASALAKDVAAPSCKPIISNCDFEIQQFLAKGLICFRDELLLFIDKNDDNGILGYSNEQTLAAFFVNGLIRRDLEGEITAMQEYKTSSSTKKNGRPDIFLRVKDMAIWIECKFDSTFKIDHVTHWSVESWLLWDEMEPLAQSRKYYESEANLINPTFTGGHYIMTLVFKLVAQKPDDFIAEAENKLIPQKNFTSDRAWFYSSFFPINDNTNIQCGIEAYGTLKTMKEKQSLEK